MKRILILSILTLALYSCEKDLIEQEQEMPESSKATVNIQTRAGTIYDFNPLTELNDIEVHIVNVGNTDRKYLSAMPYGNNLNLSETDDGSNRQRWFIAASYMGSYTEAFCSSYLVGGNSASTPSVKNLAFTPNDPSLSETFPILVKFIPKAIASSMLTYKEIYGTPYYTISSSYIEGGGIMRTNGSNINTLYMQAESGNGSGVRFRQNQYTDLAKWEVQPVGEYEVVAIQYLEIAEDLFSRNDQYIDRAEITNDKNNDIVYHFSVNGTYTESSDFSKTQGVTVAVAASVKVGLPFIGGDGSISTTHTTAKSWTFGESESKTRSIQHTVDIPVPARSKTIVEGYMTSHEASISFVATLKNTAKDETFKVKGKWSGVTASTFYCKTWDEATGRILGIYNIPVNQ